MSANQSGSRIVTGTATEGCGEAGLKDERLFHATILRGASLGALLNSVIALIALPFLGFAGRLTAVMSLSLHLVH